MSIDEQRRSFVFGNTSIDNPAITREMVDKVGDRMTRELLDALYERRARRVERWVDVCAVALVIMTVCAIIAL